MTAISAVSLNPGVNPAQTVTSNVPFTNATITFDRTFNPTNPNQPRGLNGIAIGTVVEIDIQFLLPGQTQWLDEGSTFLQSGSLVTKGVQITTDSRSFTAASPFPSGTQFRFIPTVTGQAVTIGGGSSQVVLS